MSRVSRSCAVWLSFVLLAPARPATTESNAHSCIAAHAKGQEQRAAGSLLAARELFLSCSVERCPTLVQRDCVTMGADLERALPSIVLLATDGSGRDLPGATALIDSALEPKPLDGRPITLDPGPHQLKFRFNGAEQQLTLLLAEGEKYRRVSVQFDPPRKASRASAGGPPSLAYVLGGMGLAALGSFAIFGLEGKAQQNELERCRPDCSASAVRTMRTRYLIGDLSLGVGLASLGLSAYFFLRPIDSNAGSAPGGSQAAATSERLIGVSASGAF